MSIEIKIEFEMDDESEQDESKLEDEARYVTEYVDDAWRNFPTAFRGKEYDIDSAVRFLKSYNWTDPTTGYNWGARYETFEAAESALHQICSRKKRDTSKMREEIMGPQLWGPELESA